MIKNYKIYYRELKKIEKNYKPYANGSAMTLFQTRETRKEYLAGGFCRNVKKEYDLNIPAELQNTIKDFL